MDTEEPKPLQGSASFAACRSSRCLIRPTLSFASIRYCEFHDANTAGWTVGVRGCPRTGNCRRLVVSCLRFRCPVDVKINALSLLSKPKRHVCGGQVVTGVDRLLRVSTCITRLGGRSPRPRVPARVIEASALFLHEDGCLSSYTTTKYLPEQPISTQLLSCLFRHVRANSYSSPPTSGSP